MTNPIDPASAIHRLAPRPVQALLDDLVALRIRADRGEEVVLPRVTLHLRSGRDLSGFVIALGGAATPSLLVHVPGEGRPPEADAVYLSPADIEAITLHDAPRAAAWLSAGPAPSPNAPAPSRLELKRRLAAHSSRLSKELGHPVACVVDWDALSDAGSALLTLGDAIDDTADVLVATARAPLGRDALTSIVELHFIDGAPAVTRDAGLLTIAVRLVDPVFGRLTTGDLKRAIEALL